MLLSSSLAKCINIPLVDLAVKHLDGDFLKPNLVYTIMFIPWVATAWGIARAMKRDQAAKDAKIPKRGQLSRTTSKRTIQNKVSDLALDHSQQRPGSVRRIQPLYAQFCVRSFRILRLYSSDRKRMKWYEMCSRVNKVDGGLFDDKINTESASRL
jgi:hypothetical protein